MRADALTQQQPVMAAASAFERPAERGVTARLGRAVGAGGDVLLLGAVVISIPFVILALGLPIALFAQLLLWIARLF